MKKAILLLLFFSIFTKTINFTKEEFFALTTPPAEIKSFFDEHKQTILIIKELIEQRQKPTQQQIETFSTLQPCQYTVYPCFNLSLKLGLLYMLENVHAAQLLESGLFPQLRMADCYLYQLTQNTTLSQENYAVIIEKLQKYKKPFQLGYEYAKQLTEFYLLLGIKPQEVAFNLEEEKIVIGRLFWNKSTDSDKTQSAIINELLRPHRIFKQYAPYVYWDQQAVSYLQEIKENPPAREELLTKYNLSAEDVTFPTISEVKAFIG